MFTLSSSELSSDSRRSWFATLAARVVRVDLFELSVVLLAFLSVAFLALASRALAIRALAISAFD
jgi:hypothetical protein